MKLTDISYGMTSAVITSLAIMIALSGTLNSIVTIITALLIIAIADNISDSFGIHIYQESEAIAGKKIVKTTLSNFISRLIVVAIFILLIFLFPINVAIILSIIYGIAIIAIVSYYISKQQKNSKMFASISKHILITIVVIIGSFIIREIIAKYIVELF
jgi:hypothetical protein